MNKPAGRPSPRKIVGESRKARKAKKADGTIREDAAANDRRDVAAFPIIGVGASAGGLEAFTELLQHLPVDTGMAFVLVQHLDPQHESSLPQLLGRATSMPVHSVTDKLRVAPNHVYVIPPNVGLVIAQGALRVAPRPPTRAPARSIDRFLESLAEDQQGRAIGVILSGTATDGTTGLEAIKAEGGITFAQDDSARYDSMPRSAVAAGCVDFVLSPEQIAHELARIARHPYVGGGDATGLAEPELDRAAATASEDDATPLPSGGRGSPPTDAARARAEAAQESAAPAGAKTDPQGFKKILLLLRAHSGVDFALYKSSTIRRRIARRMVLGKQENPTEYAAFLRGNTKELDALYSDVLISVTSFFRNPDAFDVLEQKVFPRLLQQRGDDPLRVWVLGCSTGQEAYSIAMAFAEAAEKAPRMRRLQVFATDLNDALLDKARHGLYAKSLVEDLEPARLRRFFVEEQGGYRVVKALREMVVFARQNVIVDPPFSRMDLVSCRNLLIYLEPNLQKKILPVFHYALKPDGFLFLGSSESIGTFTELFEPIDKKHKIYTRKAVPTPPFQPAARKERGERRDHGELLPGDGTLRNLAPSAAPSAIPAELSAQREADRITINQFAPPSVLVDADLQILQFRGATGAFLVPPTGKASFDVLKMAREGLMLPLRATITKAKKENRTARKANVRFAHNGGFRTVDIEAIPLKNLRERCFLIVFTDPGENARAEPGSASAVTTGGKPGKAKPPTREQARRIAELESALSDTRDYLQALQEQHEAANEELQASNEEVQSANEELQSINEELETSKEELESANEELSTINDEMASRNLELNRANSDLLNLQNSTRQAVILVGRDLTVRRFSPQAERQLELVAADVGRRIGALRHDLVFEPEGAASAPAPRAPPDRAPAAPASDLERLVAEVIDSVRDTEREVKDRSGRSCLLRVQPYLTIDNKVDGAVVVLIDVDEIKRSAQAVTEARDYAEAVVRTVRDPMLVLDADLRVHHANDAFYQTFRVAPDTAEGRLIYDLGNRQWDIPRLRALLEDILPGNSVFDDFEVTHDFEAIGRRTMLLNARTLGATAGHPARILLGIEDVTEQKEAEGALQRLSAELIESDRHKNEFLALLAHELRNPLTPIRTALELMRRTLPSPGDPLSPTVGMIERQVGQLVRLVDDLLDVSRISRGQIELKREPVEVASVVREAIDATRPLLDSMNHRFTISLPPEPIRVDADAMRLAQIVGNLLSNAAKFTNRGGHIALRVERDADGVVIRVQDNGIGIDPPLLGRVFDLFMQADTSLTRESAGLGIGLGLVKQLVKLHGGTVAARSDGLGQGSEFVVRLPIASAEADAERAVPPENRMPATPHRILVVDDNRDAAESLAALLRMDRHDVRTTNDGLDALAAAEAFRPRIMLLDVGLPKLSGYEVARRIRAQSWGRGIVLIALTGWGQESDFRASREAGFDHHLVKPVDLAALARLLADIAPQERSGK
ncbi:MAG TPA: chemotaxis protein CheB [Burkholderiales bacterium]|nr:chemotaxis protein CheB [Burkholderiales bacterium]